MADWIKSEIKWKNEPKREKGTRRKAYLDQKVVRRSLPCRTGDDGLGRGMGIHDFWILVIFAIFLLGIFFNIFKGIWDTETPPPSPTFQCLKNGGRFFFFLHVFGTFWLGDVWLPVSTETRTSLTPFFSDSERVYEHFVLHLDCQYGSVRSSYGWRRRRSYRNSKWRGRNAPSIYSSRPVSLRLWTEIQKSSDWQLPWHTPDWRKITPSR